MTRQDRHYNRHYNLSAKHVRKTYEKFDLSGSVHKVLNIIKE